MKTIASRFKKNTSHVILVYKWHAQYLNKTISCIHINSWHTQILNRCTCTQKTTLLGTLTHFTTQKTTKRTQLATCCVLHYTTGRADGPYREPRAGGTRLRGDGQARHQEGHQVPEQGPPGEWYGRLIIN